MKNRYMLALGLRIVYLLVLSALLTTISKRSSSQAALHYEKRCPIHHTALQPDKVKVWYGLPGWFFIDFDDFETFLQVRKESFAYANPSVSGGCIEAPDAPGYADVFYCAQCRSAEAAWIQRWMYERDFGATITVHFSDTVGKAQSTITRMQRLLAQDQ